MSDSVDVFCYADISLIQCNNDISQYYSYVLVEKIL
jgi:hypothetical protein